MDPSHALPDVASVIEDALKPYLSAVKDFGMSNGPWKSYEIQVAVKRDKDLRIVQVWATVNWPYLRTDAFPGHGPDGIINMADPDSYGVLKTKVEEAIKRKVNWDTNGKIKF